MMGGNAPLPNTPQIQAMQKAKFTEEEIRNILDIDRRIDKGEKLFELDAEMEAGAKKARRADRTDTPKPRERKPNEDKATLLNVLFSAVLPLCDTYEVTNSEREFLFTYNGTKYKVTLSAPRK